MNKLGIWGIAIVAAFVVGLLSANPVVEAVGGWQLAISEHENDSNAHGVIIKRTNSMVFSPQSTGEFQLICEDDEVILGNSLTANYDPLPARVPAVGVQFDLIGNDELGGNAMFFGKSIGTKVTVFDNNEFATDTTIILSIMCLSDPGQGILSPG